MIWAFLLAFVLGLLSKFEKENLLKLWRNEAPTKAAKMWVQLHTGDPGANCTANVAKENKRRQIEVSGIEEEALHNLNAIEWEGVSTTEKVTHASVWDAETEGNPRVYGELAKAQELIKEQDARFKIGKLLLLLK